jgi:hypothetical protein
MIPVKELFRSYLIKYVIALVSGGRGIESGLELSVS